MLVVCLAACTESHDVDELGSLSQELDGRSGSTGGSHTLSPFTGAYVNRGMVHARAVGRSSAFGQCVANTMADRYAWCTGDPYPTSSPSYQIAKAWERFANWNNNLEFKRTFDDQCTQDRGTCSSDADCCSRDCAARSDTDPTLVCKRDSAAASASPQEAIDDPYGTHTITLHNGYHRDFAEWGGYTAEQPWNWFSGNIIHEYVHTLGYNHRDNPGECDGPYRGGAPYIYGSCAANVVEESQRQCSGGIHACPAGQIKLLSSWSGFADTAQTSTTCTCVADPLHVVALRTSNGYSLTATGGGGSGITTNATSGVGAYQMFYALDWNGGAWLSGDSVDLKVFDGEHVGVDTGASTWSASTLVPRKISMVALGGGTIDNGDQVLLRAPSGQYAYNNGSSLGLTSGATSTGLFSLTEPRRDHLIFLRSMHGRYVDTDFGTGARLWNRLDTADLLSDEVEREVPAAFWVIDWNGGELESGDTISLQRYGYDSYAFVSVREGDHLGQAGFAMEVGTYERFEIRLDGGGTGPINNNNLVSLKSATNTYLTAMPAGTLGYQVRNGATSVGTSQRFRFLLAEQFDRARTTW